MVHSQVMGLLVAVAGVVAVLVVAGLVMDHRERMAQLRIERDERVMSGFGRALRTAQGWAESGAPVVEPTPPKNSPLSDEWFGVPTDIIPPWEKAEMPSSDVGSASGWGATGNPGDAEAQRALEVELARAREAGHIVPPGEQPGEGPDGV